MRMEKLVEVCLGILARNNVSLLNPTSYRGLDVRTIRYYDFEGLLSKPTKKGKTNLYSPEHVKQIVIIKLLQASGLSLSQIKTKFKTQSVRELSLETGVDETAIEILVSMNEHEPALKEGNEMSTKQQQAKKEPKNPWKDSGAVKDSRFQIRETGVAGAEADKFASSIRIGNSFVFFKSQDDTVAKVVHTLLYGQKNKGETKQAVIHVKNGEELELPFYNIKAPADKQTEIGALVPDKDVYQESSGIATIFVFLPKSTGKVTAGIQLNDAVLGFEEVELDANGCGLLRVATHVGGQYKVTVNSLSCEFQAASYELVPLTVTGKVRRTQEGGLIVQMQGEKYGVAYDSVANVTLVAGGKPPVDIQQVTFLEGIATVSYGTDSLKDLGEASLSIRIADKEDAKLLASFPLTGAKESERKDTEMGCLGRVVTCSMLHAEGAEESRGVFLTKGAYTNAPITIECHIAEKATLVINEDVKDMVVVVETAEGESEVIEVGNKKAGSKVNVKLTNAYSVLRIGAFICDEPWEGHAVVLKKTNDVVQLEVPDQAEPRSTLTLKLTSKKPVSVLLKICDKRLRASYEPMSKTASSAKSWLEAAYKVTGFVAKQLPKIVFAQPQYNTGFLRSALFGSPRTFGVSGMGGGERPRSLMARARHEKGIDRESFGMRASGDQSMNAGSAEPIMTYFSAGSPDVFGSTAVPESLDYDAVMHAMAMPDYDANRMVSLQSLSPAPMAGVAYAAADIDAGAPRALSLKAVKTRTSIEDALFCDLITVDGEREVTIRLPDVIGFFDIKAFCVSGLDWQEINTHLNVKKDLYIEPLIPVFAHPEDGVSARAVIVGDSDNHVISVKVDGKDVAFDVSKTKEGRHIRWNATPGCHEVSVLKDGQGDKVMRVIEAPGEDVVLSQEVMILKKGKTFRIEDGVMSINVVPSMQEDLKQAVHVMQNYQHLCCEQSSASLVAAAFAVVTGGDDERSNGYKSLILAEAKFKSLSCPQGFYYYNGGTSFNYWASKVAGKRIGLISKILPSKLPSDVQKAVNSLLEMGRVAENHVSTDNSGWYQSYFTASEQEKKYFDGDFKESEKTAEKLLALDPVSFSRAKAEAGFCAASLIKAKKLDIGIDLANAVARSMKGGNGWHGTCDLLAYMFMVLELKDSGIVSGGKASKLKVNGKTVTLEDAIATDDVNDVEATTGPVALRVNRLEKINLFKRASDLQMKVELKGKKATFRPGDLVTLSISLPDGYTNGDVACVALPNSLSKIVSGAQIKKFQIDFAGKSELEIELIATSHSDKPERWATVVRNMYDSERIGSVGLMTVEVKK